MNNEPVAWMNKSDDETVFIENTGNTKIIGGNPIPLYTAEQFHPAKELNAGGEQVKNATYWKRQYNEMSALNDRLKSSLYHANEQIKYLESHPAKHLSLQKVNGELVAVTYTDDEYRIIEVLWEKPPAKTLTDEEILGAIARGWCSEKNSSKTMDSDLAMAIANEVKAILRKAQEK